MAGLPFAELSFENQAGVFFFRAQMGAGYIFYEKGVLAFLIGNKLKYILIDDFQGLF